MDKFDKKLANKILPKFTNAKEWTDLITILKKLKESLKKYENYNMRNLTDKITLSKRLAQCLNSGLPGGVHQTALEIYDLLFDNIKKNNNNFLGEDLGLYSSGLFPFFTYASTQNKFIFLDDIIKKHYLTLDKTEFSLCLSGMISSIIPGIEEQNETMQKNIKDIFSESRKIVGDSFFFGILWSIILRNHRLRLVCIKYISEVIPIYKTFEEQVENSQEKLMQYFPNISVLVLNSLKVLVEEGDLYSQRVGMDFIIKRFPIYNTFFTEDNKISLLISALRLLIKNDYSTTRRLLMWLMGPGQEEELEMGDPNIKFMIELLIKALKKMFDRNEKNINKDNLLNGLKIIDQLFKQQVKLVDYILEFISIDMISAIEAYWEKTNSNQKDDIIIKVKSFYSYDPGYLDCLWNSLGKKLKTVEINEIDFIIKILEFCLMNVQLAHIDKKIKFYIPIISSLLKGLQFYQIESSEDLSKVDPLIVLALKFTKSLQEGLTKEDLTIKQKSKKTFKIRTYNENAIKFSYQKGNSLHFILKENEQNGGLIELLMENILLYHKVYITLCQVMLNEFEVETEDNRELIRENISVFKNATELALLIQEYVTQETIPAWIIFLEKVIFNPNIDLSLEGIFYLLDLFMVSSENQVYDNIKNYLRTEEGPENIIDKSLIEKLIFQTHVRRDCIELSMARLWILLEDPYHQKPVIDLIIKFFIAEQNVFQNTISNTFAINDLEQNVNAIKKFAQFWKLTSEFYPDMIFFENGECIFKMLDFLEHEHPLLRHLSKSWLSEAKDQFRKILDPLLKVLLDRDTSWYISFQKQLYFTKEYDNRRIIEAFRKLKNIIINAPDIAIQYFVSQKITQSLLDMDDIGKELRSVSKAISIEHYLELLVSISLRFIQGKFIESISFSFYRENFSVNAASCEFLEFLLSFIEQKSKVMNIAQIISEPVLSILEESLMMNDEVMQVQLLNLLKVLLLNTKDEHANFKQDAINIFNSTKFHECLVKGIQINYIFVRGYFIDFIESCLPIFHNILDENSNLKIAKRLINTITELLVSRVKFNFSNKKSNKLSSIELKEGENAFVIKNYKDQYKEFKKLDENDVLVIIKGLKNILFHFLMIDNSTQMANNFEWEKLKKEFDSKSSSSFSFLGFFNRSSSLSVSSQEGTAIKEEILEILQDVFASFCTCWINSSDLYMTKDYCFNENGIFSTSFADFSFGSDNQMGFIESHIKVQSMKQKHNQQLKDQVIQILKKIFMKNPFDFMKNFINLFQNENNKYISKDKQYKLTLIEMLVSIQIPLEIFLLTINKNINLTKVKDYKKSKVKLKDIYPYYLNKSQCTSEAKICQMVYAFINYSTHIIVDKTLCDTWNEMITLINILMDSKSSITLFWLYEIINLLLIKLPLRDSISDIAIKKKLSAIVTNLFNRLLDLCIINKYDSVFEESTQLITPLPPSFYEKCSIEIFREKITKKSKDVKENQRVINKKKENKEESKTNNENKEEENNNNNKEGMQNKKDEEDETKKSPIKAFYNLIIEYIVNKTILKNEDHLTAYRNIGFITLKSLFYPTMRNIFSQDKLTFYFQLLIKNLISLMSEKEQLNRIYVELSTEFLHNLIINASSIICNSCKQMIMDIFLEPEFFNMSRYCLRLWKDIINEFAHSYQGIINDLMDKMNQTGFFAKNTDQFNIKAMRRISFIIYSSPKDTYSTKLGLILEKVKEIITKYSENPILESEIFFMLRILFLRFSHENLIEMIRALWPIIFSELVNVINDKKKKKKSLDLNISSFKLIELLSVANKDEFCLYQWIFFLDTFKVKDMDIDEENNELNKIIKSQSKAFKPFALGMAKNWEKCKDLINDYNHKKWELFEKRSLMIQVQKLVSESELSMLVAKVFVYIGIMNNFKNNIDLEAIEEVIESDFLNNTS